MSSLIENKNRILSTFSDIYNALRRKDEEAVNNVNLYAAQIRELIQKDTIHLVKIGTYSLLSFDTDIRDCFTLNAIGQEYFITENNKNICIKDGIFFIYLCAGAVSPVNGTVSNISLEKNERVIQQVSNSSNVWSIYSEADRLDLSVEDEINLYSYKSASSGTPSSSVYLSNSAIIYLLTDK